MVTLGCRTVCDQLKLLVRHLVNAFDAIVLPWQSPLRMPPASVVCAELKQLVLTLVNELDAVTLLWQAMAFADAARIVNSWSCLFFIW